MNGSNGKGKGAGIDSALRWGLLLSGLALFPWVQDPGAPKAPLLCFFALLILLRSSNSVSLPIALWSLCYLLYNAAKTTGYVNSSESQLFALLGLLAFHLGFQFRSRGWIPPALIVTSLILIRGLLDFLTFQPWEGVPGTLTSFFLHKNILGFLLNPVLFFHLWLWPRRRDLPKQLAWVFYANLLLLPFIFVLTASRGAQLGALLGLGFFLFLRREFSVPMRLRFYCYGFFLLVGMLLISLIPNWQYQAVLETFAPSNGETPFRFWAWEAALELISQSPLWGHGNGSFRYLVIPFQDPNLIRPIDPFILMRNAHSHFLEVLSDRGSIGLLLELCALLPALFFLFKSARRKDFAETCTLAALVAVTVHSLFAEASEFPTSSLLYWCLIGMGWRRAPERFRKPLDTSQSRIWKLAFFSILPLLWLAETAAFVRQQYFDFLYVRSRAIQEKDPAGFSRNIGRILEGMPSHPQAAHLWAVRLGEAGQFEKARKQIEFVDAVAPNQMAPDIFLATLFYRAGNFDSAYHYAVRVQYRFPFFLPTFEILIRSSIRLGLCHQVDSMVNFAKHRLLRHYPALIPDKLTPRELDSIYRRDDRIRDLQRRIGGKSLREKWYGWTLTQNQINRENHDLVNSMMKIDCRRNSQ